MWRPPIVRSPPIALAFGLSGGQASGGAISGASGSVVNCIFAANTADSQDGAVDFSTATLDSCLFFNNAANVNPNYDPATAVASNIVTSDPVLGPLSYNGGLTQTMAALGAGQRGPRCRNQQQRP